MKESIEKALQVLVGQPFSVVSRTVDMNEFNFGPLRKSTSRLGRERVTGEYTLHILCAWRIRRGNRIPVASRDRYYPPDSHDSPDDYDWARERNRCDTRLEALLRERADSPLIVQQVDADDVGSVNLFLSGDHVLEIFPDDSFEGEHWRMFRPDRRDHPHFVCAGEGLRVDE